MVAVILFEGGLTLKLYEWRESGAPILGLCTIGALVSMVLSSLVIHYLLGFDWRVAALLGAILVVTGPTVIAPLLRHVQPSRKVGALLKWEGIVVDPIGAILAVLVFQATFVDHDQPWQGILQSIVTTIAVNVLFGYVLGRLLGGMLRRHWIPDFLEGYFFLAAVAFAFTAANAIQKESGLLAVTIMGMVLANRKQLAVRELLTFKEHLRVLIISLLFVLLAGRISPEQMKEAFWPALTLFLALIVVVRPVSVYLATQFRSGLSWNERHFIAAMAPRGIVAAAVTSVFALEILHITGGEAAGGEIAREAAMMVPIVFLVIIGTVGLYGLAAVPLAELLGIASKTNDGVLFAGASAWVRQLAHALQENGHACILLDTNFGNVSAARMRGLAAHRVSILSEYAEEEMDLSGIGQLVAALSNDGVNSLAASELSHHFGRANVWQIRPRPPDTAGRAAISESRQARICFSGAPTWLMLEKLASEGWQVKRTTFTEKFGIGDFLQQYEAEPIALFLLGPKEKPLRPFAADSDIRAIPAGTTLFALVPPKRSASEIK